MNIQRLLVLTALLPTVFLCAEDAPNAQNSYKNRNRVKVVEEKKFAHISLKGRVAAFRPQERVLRKIYKDFWPEYSIEFDCRFHPHFSTFANVAYTSKSGHSTGLHNRTSAYFIPITAGAKGYFLNPKLFYQPYVGVAVGAVYTHFRDHSSFVKPTTIRWGFSSLFQAGITLDIKDGFFFDAFTSYRLNWIHFEKHNGVTTHQVQTGGLQFGGGFGYHF